MYCIALSIRLFSKEEWIWWLSFRNLQARGYHVPPSVESGCFPNPLTNLDRNLSETNMFLSFVMDSARISLFFWLNGYPKPSVFGANLDCCLVNHEFGDFPSLWWNLLRTVFVNPVPDCNMASLDNMQKWGSLGNASGWQTQKVQIQTMANVLWGCPVSRIGHTRNGASSSYKIS